MVTLLKHSPSVPKLDNQFANGSYGASGSAIARMDPSQTVDDNERKLASRTRPTTVGGKTTQQTQTMVSRDTHPISVAPTAHEEITSIHS